MKKRLYRTENPRMIFGVCGGLSEYFNIDVSLMRVLFVLLIFTGIPIILIYLLMVLLIKSEYE